MSTQVRKSNGDVLVNIPDGTINASSSSLSLIGRNAVNFSQHMAENFLHLVENFANHVQPEHPMAGQLWYDTTASQDGVGGVLRLYTGAEWVRVGDAVGCTNNPLKIAGSASVTMNVGGFDRTFTLGLSEGKIITILSEVDAIRDALPSSVEVNGTSYDVLSRFSNGLKKGLNLSTSEKYRFNGGNHWGPSRTIKFERHATGFLTMDGSADATVNLTLEKSGVKPGTYDLVTVDVYGRVTFGTRIANRQISIQGDVLGTSDELGFVRTRLEKTGVSPGSYGNEFNIPVIQVDTKGRITSAKMKPIPMASDTQTGIVMLSNSIHTDRTDMAPTSQALKAVNDKVDEKLSLSGGTIRGNVGLAGNLSISGRANFHNSVTIDRDFELRGNFTKAGFGLVPTGGIIMWSGRDIPEGWALCDGTNKTPDLRNRFVIGAGDEYNPHQKGGEKNVTLTEENLPSHTHTGTISSDGRHKHSGSSEVSGSHIHDIMGGTGGDTMSSPKSGGGNIAGMDGPDTWLNSSSYNLVRESGDHSHDFETDYSGEHDHAVSIDPAGSNQPHENMPPFYALAYIMKL